MRLRSALIVSVTAVFASCSPSGATPDAGADGEADGGAAVASCPSLGGAGTLHASPTADETWTAEASPHLVRSSLTIPSGVTVTIEACATVQLGDAVDLVVNGQLVSRGAQGRPVRFSRLDSEKPWGQLDATRTQSKPAIELTWTTLEGGGRSVDTERETSSMVRVRANRDSGGEPMIGVDHVELRGSSSVGIELADSATFTATSTALTVTGSASAPVRLSGWALTTLPDGDYSGNAVDRIVVNPSERLGVSGLTRTIVMHRRNVPYRVGAYGNNSVITLGAPTGLAVTTLQIEAGTQVDFNKDTGLFIASVSSVASGELIISGTASAPVTLTSSSATPVAGDWRGIMFGAPPTAATRLEHVIFEYSGSTNTQTSGFSCGTEPAPGGAKGGIMGALSFATDRPVTRQILTHSVIRDSGSNGIDRGWAGDPVDYLATNSFERITWCRQTAPKPAVGSCANPAPCD